MMNIGNRKGFSILELVISAAVLSIILGFIMKTTIMSSDAEQFARSQEKITLECQKELLKIRKELISSVKLFQKDTTGEGYWAKLELGNITPITLSRLPVLDVYGTFNKDSSSSRKTGHVLLFAKAVRPFTTGE